MLVLELLNFNNAFILSLSKIIFPIAVKLLEFLVTNIDILSQLNLLNICAQIVLEEANVSLEESDFSH